MCYTGMWDAYNKSNNVLIAKSGQIRTDLLVNNVQLSDNINYSLGLLILSFSLFASKLAGHQSLLLYQ